MNSNSESVVLQIDKQREFHVGLSTLSPSAPPAPTQHREGLVSHAGGLT
jgi:hypothetical protein